MIKAESYDKEKIRKKIKRSLDHRRYNHTLGVAYTAAALAMRYNEDIEKAEVAGLLHDCAKCMDAEDMLVLCDKHRINVTDVERRNPFLLHAKLGGFMAMQTYNVNDKQIISAIINHTTGRPDMNMLEKILLVADYIEPNRMKAPHLKEIRHMAFSEIDKALVLILGDTLDYLNSIQGEKDDMTQKSFDYYSTLQKENING